MEEKEELIPSEGEIMIETDSDIDYDFMNTFSKKLGYEYLGEWEYGINLHIIKVPSGKEGEIIYELSDKYAKFIRSAFRRYPLIDNRFKFTEGLEGMIVGLNDYVEETEFTIKLEEIVKYIKNFKD